MRKHASTAALLAASGGLAVGLALLRQSPAFSILGHGLMLKGRMLPPFLALWAAFFFGLALGLQLWAKSRSLATGRPEDAELQRGAIALLPFAALFFAPTLLQDFLTRDDFRMRLGLLVALALAASLYLGLASRSGLAETTTKGKKKKRTLPRRFLAWPLRRRLGVLGLAAFLLYGGAAALITAQGTTFSGDEPNYLINAHSLLYDRDVNLANNYAARDWFHFYSEKSNPGLKLGVYAREGKKGRDHVYPINLPGVSALIVPFYALGQAFGDSLARTAILKGSLIIWAVLLGLQLYLLARELWKREGLAFGLWAVYAFSTPVLFYAVHLYPEIPIALFSIYIYRMVRSGRVLRPLHLAFMGVLLGSFFWFGLKYNLIFWPLLAVAVFDLWKTAKAPQQDHLARRPGSSRAGPLLFRRLDDVRDDFPLGRLRGGHFGPAGPGHHPILPGPAPLGPRRYLPGLLPGPAGRALPLRPLLDIRPAGLRRDGPAGPRRAHTPAPHRRALRPELRLLHPSPGLLSARAGADADLLDRSDRRRVFPGPRG